MKSVLISIRPKWCEKIANGEKTVEVRKTRPKLETPFKCYIYCTYGKGLIEYNDPVYPNSLLEQRVSKNAIWGNCCNGKVIGEFVCDVISQYEAELWDDNTFERIREFYEPDDFAEYGEYEYQTIADNGDEFWQDNMLCKASCVSIEELRNYIGQGIHDFYGWHISKLKIYDTPKELSEFYKECVGLDNTGLCYECENAVGEECDCGVNGRLHLTRAPQSWCYVKGGEG